MCKNIVYLHENSFQLIGASNILCTNRTSLYEKQQKKIPKIRRKTIKKTLPFEFYKLNYVFEFGHVTTGVQLHDSASFTLNNDYFKSSSDETPRSVGLYSDFNSRCNAM